MEVIKYRQYRFEELREAFFQSPVFFSRSSNFRAGCPGRADVVQAFLVEETVDGLTAYSAMIIADLQNQMDYVNESLRRQGYDWNSGECPTWTKKIKISAERASGPLGLQRNILTALDDLVNRLPMCLYESRQTKRLRDYVNFMTAWKSKMRYSAIVDYRNPKRESLPKCARKAAQSGYLRRGFGSMADAYCIAELPDKHWCAWVDGDEAIPVFPSEKLAVQFLENRHVLHIAN